MASRRIHIRGKLDPNPREIVQVLERILKRGKEKLQACTSQIQRSFSLPEEEVTSLENTFF